MTWASYFSAWFLGTPQPTRAPEDAPSTARRVPLPVRPAAPPRAALRQSPAPLQADRERRTDQQAEQPADPRAGSRSHRGEVARGDVNPIGSSFT